MGDATASPDHDAVLQAMREDLVLRGLSPNTVASYTLSARAFLQYAGRPVDMLDVHDIRKFLTHLIEVKHLTPATLNCYSAAMRFLFAVTLSRPLNYLQIPRQKRRKALPTILSRAEVASLLDHCANLKHRAMLTLVYGSGLRVSEAATLKVSDIDSKAMRVFVTGGKGNKDRYTILSATCLTALREYWRAYRPQHPDGWLFLGTSHVGHITTSGVALAFKQAVRRARIPKDVSIHSLRHCFATHLLEDGATLLQIKELLGHASIHSTTVYLHLANLTAGIHSPLDHFPAGERGDGVAHG